MPTESTTPNFFLLLELNPDDRWDEKEFERVLTQKQREWGLQSQGIGQKATIAKRNIQLIPQIRRVMNDSAEREKLAVAARAERAAGRQKRIEEFETQLKIAQGKGYLEEGEVKSFVADFKDVLAEKEIRSSIKVPIQTQAPEQPKTAQQLEASIAKEIAEKLAQLNLSSLYELLGRAPTHSRADLAKLAEQLYLDMVPRQPKTVEVTLKQELAGHAKKIFASDEMRKKYDESLRLAPINALLKVLDDTLNRATRKEVYAQQVLDFLEAAQQVGWSREEALTRLEEHVRMRKWFMQVPTLDMTPQQRCGYCSQVNDKSRNFCQRCNRELNIACPQCGQRVPADAVGCGNCGFRVGDRYWVDDSLEKSRLLLASWNLKEAQELLSELETAWNPGKADKRAEKIRSYKAEAQRLLQAQQEVMNQLNQYMSQRQFYTARHFLATQAQNLPDRATYQYTIGVEISRAQELLKRAQSSTLNREERADLCRQALRVCADYQEARVLLSTMPPGPPTNLQARVEGTIVSLVWDLSPTQGVIYKIVRKSRSKPVSVQDGTALGTVRGRMYDDTQTEIGLPLYYAIFAESEGIVSAQGAVLDQPVLLKQDVSNVIVQVNHASVDLSWQIPPNTAAVLVMRKEGEAPRSINDGTSYPLLDLTHLNDQEVQNDHLYFYSIYCQFKDVRGQLVPSSGVTVKARPETPPEPVKDLEITSTKVAQGYEVELRWQPPVKGRTMILKSGQQIPFKVGQVLQKSQLGQYGQIVQEESPGRLVLKGMQPGIGFCTPIVLLGEAAYVGVCKKYACIENISELTYQNLGTSLRLQWKWPPNCQEALVSYSYRNWPKPGEQKENTHKVTRTEYEFHGHYDIKGTTMSQNYYIIVAAVIGQGREQVTSSGIRIEALLAEKIVVTYEIRNPTLFRKKRTLHLFPRNAGKLPALLLFSKRDRLPMSKAEGELLLRIEPSLVEKDKEIVIELADTSFPPRTFGRLFLEDDSWYSVVDIKLPDKEKLRLS